MAARLPSRLREQVAHIELGRIAPLLMVASASHGGCGADAMG